MGQIPKDRKKILFEISYVSLMVPEGLLERNSV